MKSDTQPKTTCEVCGNRELTPVLNLGAHPMCDDLVKVGDTRVCRTYPIEILYCPRCRTAHQRFQVPKQDLFPVSYHYRSRFTADVLNGMRELVASCAARFGSLRGKRVLDIGCNDGSLLGFFGEQGALTFGIEPTGAAADAQQQGHTVYNGYLGVDLAKRLVAEHGRPDVITFTNVFAHIENLPEVLASLRELLSPATVIVIENHYLGAVLDRNQFDTFYHEHPRTYSAGSFREIAHSLGLPLTGVEFPARYGGNIRVFLGGPATGAGEALARVDAIEAEFGARFAAMRQNIERWRARKGAMIDQLVKQHGPLRAKAFPGRAAILVQLLGLDQTKVSMVHEKPGSMKLGHYLPGTRIPIVSDEELFQAARSPAPILNLAWHISGEIRQYLQQHGVTAPVVDIMNVEDFAG
jgi:SAM-dependent methyltransferase